MIFVYVNGVRILGAWTWKDERKIILIWHVLILTIFFHKSTDLSFFNRTPNRNPVICASSLLERSLISLLPIWKILKKKMIFSIKLCFENFQPVPNLSSENCSKFYFATEPFKLKSSKRALLINFCRVFVLFFLRNWRFDFINQTPNRKTFPLLTQASISKPFILLHPSKIDFQKYFFMSLIPISLIVILLIPDYCCPDVYDTSHYRKRWFFDKFVD